MQKRRSHVFIGYGRFCISFRIWNFAFCITDLLLDRVALNVGPVAVQRALNVRLPYDIRVLGVVDATPGFHARFQSAGKSYRYRIVTTPVLSPFDRFTNGG